MKWSDLKNDIAAVAPALGTAIAGPAGAGLGLFIAQELGTPATPEAVGAAIATPEGRAALETIQARYKLMGAVLAADQSAAAEGARTVRAEVRADSWMTRNWRPLTMLIFVAIVANNFLIAPYIQAIFADPLHPLAITLPMPPDLWALLKMGLGGYVVGRSGEKMAAAWRGSA